MNAVTSRDPARTITKAASRQTYYTIGLLVDRRRTHDAYRSYAYFRWVDDLLDGPAVSKPEREAILARQKALLAGCYAGSPLAGLSAEEQMLADLVSKDPDPASGLHIYLHNMMAVMDFDARRRDRLVSQVELSDYTRLLSVAVTEAMHYFIGHNCFAPRSEARYLAVTAAHITHMLRDTLDDVRAGYFNIPREFLHANGIQAGDVARPAYRTWVKSRVNLARAHFSAGRKYMAQVRNPRCRLAGYAYMARFESVLTAIERDGYLLKPHYQETRSFASVLKGGLSVLTPALAPIPAIPVDGRAQLEPSPGRKS